MEAKPEKTPVDALIEQLERDIVESKAEFEANAPNRAKHEPADQQWDIGHETGWQRGVEYAIELIRELLKV